MNNIWRKGNLFIEPLNFKNASYLDFGACSILKNN